MLHRSKPADVMPKRLVSGRFRSQTADGLNARLGEMRDEIETIHHELEWVTSQLRKVGTPTERAWPQSQEEGAAKLGPEYWLG